MAKARKYYTVWKGRRTGVFDSWDACEAQVAGYAGAQYKAFETREAAERAYRGAYDEYKGKRVSALSPQRLLEIGRPIVPSYAVDASCQGNPGLLEYRCVRTENGEPVFRQGPFEHGTNNVGEFLAIAHALALLTSRGIDLPIYSDSENALAWVRLRTCKTRLVRDALNAELFELIARAEAWLRANSYANPLLKWETEAWGEIPADYGRK